MAKSSMRVLRVPAIMHSNRRAPKKVYTPSEPITDSATSCCPASDIVNDSNFTGTTVADALNHLMTAWTQEVLSGSLKNFSLTSLPIADKCVTIFVNGLMQMQGVHYTISGLSIIFSENMAAEWQITATYFKKEA